MSPQTLKEFKTHAKKLSDLYEVLVKEWNGDLKNGNNATYPVTIIISVILRNIVFDSSIDDHDEAVNKVRNSIETLRKINEYENGSYMSHFPYNEISML